MTSIVRSWTTNPWLTQVPGIQTWNPAASAYVTPSTVARSVGASALAPLNLFVGSAASTPLIQPTTLTTTPAVDSMFRTALGRGDVVVRPADGTLITNGKFGDCNFMTASGTQTAFATGIDWSEPSSYKDERGNLIDAFEPHLRDRNFGYFEIEPQLLNALPESTAMAERTAATINRDLAAEAVIINHGAKPLDGWYLPSVFNLTQSEPNFPNILLEYILQKRPDAEPPFAFVHKDAKEALANYRVAEIMDIVIEDLKLLYYFHKNQISNNLVRRSGEYQALAYLTPIWRSYILKMLDAAANSKMNKASPLEASRLCCDEDSDAYSTLISILPYLSQYGGAITASSMNPFLISQYKQFWQDGNWNYNAWQDFMARAAQTQWSTRRPPATIKTVIVPQSTSQVTPKPIVIPSTTTAATATTAATPAATTASVATSVATTVAPTVLPASTPSMTVETVNVGSSPSLTGRIVDRITH